MKNMQEANKEFIIFKSKEILPVAPVAPFEPGDPAFPVSPVSPAGPISLTRHTPASVTLGEPVAPVANVFLVGTVGPEIPTALVDPEAPTDPVPIQRLQQVHHVQQVR